MNEVVVLEQKQKHERPAYGIWKSELSSWM